jgi:hypothetical protein
VDLFINNGGTSDWNAQVNTGGSDFENQVYCRVRNVGDAAATGVTVTFHYAKIGSASTGWLPMVDKNGVTQTLSIGTLAAGTESFPDSQQNTPPGAAMVKWFIPPIPSSETVDHYCIRAVVSATNDVNAHNNEVQSNIAYALFGGLTDLAPFRFMVRNPTRERLRVDLAVDAKLPKDWRVRTRLLGGQPTLPPNGEAVAEVLVTPGRAGALPLAPPFDGRVEGLVRGSWSGNLRGHLAGASVTADKLTGRLSGLVEEFGQLTGAFEGSLDRDTGRLRGRWSTAARCGKSGTSLCLYVDAVLHPTRCVDVAQMIDGRPQGGVTLWIQVPLLGDDEKLLAAQTGTRARGREPRQRNAREARKQRAPRKRSRRKI